MGYRDQCINECRFTRAWLLFEKNRSRGILRAGAFVGWVGGLLWFHRGAEHRTSDISVVSRMLSSVICVSLRVGSVQLRLVPHMSIFFRMMDFMAEMTF